MFNRVLSLTALTLLVGAILYSASISGRGRPEPAGEITFDCDPAEDFHGHIRDSAGDLRHKAGFLKLTKILADNSDLVEAYRLTWERSFHWPYVFTLLIHHDGTGKLLVFAWDGHPAYGGRTIWEEMEAGEFKSAGQKPVTQMVDDVIAMSREDVEVFSSSFVGEAFWELPNFSCKPPGNDGSGWTIEGVREDGYQYVRRWSPKDGPVRVLGEWFVSASGLDVGPVY